MDAYDGPRKLSASSRTRRLTSTLSRVQMVSPTLKDFLLNELKGVPNLDLDSISTWRFSLAWAKRHLIGQRQRLRRKYVDLENSWRDTRSMPMTGPRFGRTFDFLENHYLRLARHSSVTARTAKKRPQSSLAIPSGSFNKRFFDKSLKMTSVEIHGFFWRTDSVF
jgi:hypothetical protein